VDFNGHVASPEHDVPVAEADEFRPAAHSLRRPHHPRQDRRRRHRAGRPDVHRHRRWAARLRFVIRGAGAVDERDGVPRVPRAGFAPLDVPSPLEVVAGEGLPEPEEREFRKRLQFLRGERPVPFPSPSGPAWYSRSRCSGDKVAAGAAPAGTCFPPSRSARANRTVVAASPASRSPAMTQPTRGTPRPVRIGTTPFSMLSSAFACLQRGTAPSTRTRDQVSRSKTPLLHPLVHEPLLLLRSRGPLA